MSKEDEHLSNLEEGTRLGIATIFGNVQRMNAAKFQAGNNTNKITEVNRKLELVNRFARSYAESVERITPKLADFNGNPVDKAVIDPNDFVDKEVEPAEESNENDLLVTNNDLEGQIDGLRTKVADNEEDEKLSTMSAIPPSLAGPDSYSYTGPYALAERVSGELYVMGGLITTWYGTFEFSEAYKAISDGHYMVLKITLDPAAATPTVTSALETSSSLVTIVSTGLIRRYVIGQKVANGYIQHHEGNIVIDANLKASACMTSTSTATSGTSATWSFSAIDHETNTDIIDAALATTITIKKGFSGVYKLTLHCYGIIEIAAGATGTATIEAWIADPAVLLYWVLRREETAYSSASVLEKHDSSSKPLFIDASAADVTLTVKYTINTGSATGTLAVQHFGVELIQLTDSATP